MSPKEESQQLLIAADFLEEHGFPICERLREMSKRALARDVFMLAKEAETQITVDVPRETAVKAVDETGRIFLLKNVAFDADSGTLTFGPGNMFMAQYGADVND